MVRDLKYRVEPPQYLRMTLEDCSMCMKNFTDPMLSSTTLCDSPSDTDIAELLELQSQQTGFPEELSVFSANQKFSFQDAVKSLADSIYYNTIIGCGKIQSPKIEQWLSENFVEKEHVSIARSEMYNYYSECCQHHGEVPCNQATFGKVVRVVFPNVMTRRIGVRGQSKYHYFGIGPAKDERKVTASNPDRPNIAQDNTDKDCSISSVLDISTDLRPDGYSEIEPYLTGFPTIKTVSPRLKYRILANEFLQMYKDHAITVINEVVKADFEKVKQVIKEFWTSLSVKLHPVISQSEFLLVIEQCDLLIYFVINDILVPEVPDLINKGLTKGIRDFIDSISEVLKDSLMFYPDVFQNKKISVFMDFQQSILKQLQINNIYTVASIILGNKDVSNGLLKEWKNIDRSEVHARVSVVVQHISKREVEFYMNKIQEILGNSVSTAEQLTSLVQTILQEYSHSRERSEFQTLVLHWTFVTGQIIQLISDIKSPVTGIFTLLDVLCKDYLLYLIERQIQI